MKISKTKRIDEIVSFLDKGLNRKDFIHDIAKKYNCALATADRDLMRAKDVILARNKKREEIRLKETTDAIKSQAKDAILSDLEIEAILCNIIKGGYTVEEMLRGEVILRNIAPLEIIAAAKTIYAKRGSNAPTKIATTDTEGNNVKQVMIINGRTIEF